MRAGLGQSSPNGRRGGSREGCDDRGLGTQTADRSLIIKFSQMFDALN
jgi:hypothetical protein